MKKILSLIIVLSMAVVCCACGAQRDSSGISLEEFQEIDIGMYLSDVEEIVGGNGTQISKAEDETDEYCIYTYVYKFHGELNGYAELEFSKKYSKADVVHFDNIPKLSSKKQIDLS